PGKRDAAGDRKSAVAARDEVQRQRGPGVLTVVPRNVERAAEVNESGVGQVAGDGTVSRQRAVTADTDGIRNQKSAVEGEGATVESEGAGNGAGPAGERDAASGLLVVSADGEAGATGAERTIADGQIAIDAD